MEATDRNEVAKLVRDLEALILRTEDEIADREWQHQKWQENSRTLLEKWRAELAKLRATVATEKR